ncbi:DUF551 domain-containing protein [Enterobacter roggenkampii]|uniref:DUF551 domain-containing protein n=1 Tax=Enterobacter roggenkampii TaxID=1812935 RepID=UPI002A81D9E9|nr:DUF551 domain-containing protein [Enterobacter roggenkampii]
MSTITREFTKEQLIEKLQHRIAVAAKYPDFEEAQLDQVIFKIALASLEAEPVCVIDQSNLDYLKSGSDADVWPASRTEMGDVLLYRTAPPAPVSVQECFKRLLHHAYGMTMGHDWNKGTMAGHHRTKLCQAVEECRAAMLQSLGNSEQLNYPVIPDGWVACSERMPDIGTEIFYFCQDDGLRDCGVVSSSNFSGKGDAQLYVHAEGYDLRFGVDITHWMPLPAAPQQEVNNDQ